MAVYCGTDIVSVERIKNSIEELGDTFIKRIYTDEEIEYCESRRMCKYQSYAARFAAKEAAYKAISPETMDEITWHDAEIIKKPNGKPVMKLNGKLARLADERGLITENIDVSLSHDDVYATATVVINK
ncbi:MAG: holo-ACP synthase [Clostridia bacterium]|nr:holo-ACP synthase [Clostridia bacterium]